MSKFNFFFCVIALVSLSNHSSAQEITFGDAGVINLLADTPGQEIEFFLSDNPTVDSLGFVVQIGDGGTAAGGTLEIGPVITSVDLLSQTIFDGGTQTDVTTEPFAILSNAESPTDGAGGLSPITEDGVIAVVTFDTTGVSVGEEFPIDLAVGTVSTTFSFEGDDVPVSFTAGSIAIVAVPEPSSVWLVAVIGSVVALGRRRA